MRYFDAIRIASAFVMDAEQREEDDSTRYIVKSDSPIDDGFQISAEPLDGISATLYMNSMYINPFCEQWNGIGYTVDPDNGRMADFKVPYRFEKFLPATVVAREGSGMVRVRIEPNGNPIMVELTPSKSGYVVLDSYVSFIG